jgi:hypothetical protein
MKNVKKIASDLQNTLRDPGFESFIADQIMSSKSSKEDDPIISITHRDITLEVWKRGHSYSIVKSILPGSRKAGRGFTKELKRNELMDEIKKHIELFLD